MSAFRPVDPFAVYFDLTGNLAAGGTLHFYESGTTTDADVYGDSDLSTNNGATIDIGTDGRAVDDIWGDASVSYRCRVYDADDTLITDVDEISAPGASSTTIPTLVSNQFLTNNGTTMSWAAIRQALDPSGANNKLIGSDGTNLVWVAKPADGAAGDDGTSADVTATDGKVTIGNGSSTDDLFMVQWGSSTAPAASAHQTNKSITFGTAFKVAPYVQCTGREMVSGGIGVFGTPTVVSTTGFTVTLGTNDDNDAATIINDIDFDWVAIGIVAAS